MVDSDRTIFPVETNDEIVIADTKEWVRAIIADFGVCPFTMDPERAGIPMGGVRYTVSRAASPEEAFLRYWEEVVAVLSSSEKEIATVLLVFPELELFGNYDLFEAYCECLGDALHKSSLSMEAALQLVFFHPKYQFRDGKARASGDMGAANFARRGPWPMINILRTPQVRAAQKGVPTGQVYQQNEARLQEVGTEVLEKMLYTRDWAGLPAYSVKAKRALNEQAVRRLMEEGRGVAGTLDLVESGTETTSEDEKCPFPHDSTIKSAPVPPSLTPVPLVSPTQEPILSKVNEVAAVPAKMSQADAVHGSTVETKMAEITRKEKEGVASVEDYASFADEIERYMSQFDESTASAPAKKLEVEDDLGMGGAEDW
jgi:hypothetical protein